MIRNASLARKLWSRLEPIHAVTYFSPEPVSALADAGYKGFWMGYFAGRAAPLGPVGPDVVFATFYNFALTHVARAIPDAWAFAPPGEALRARLAGSVAALRRAFEPSDLDTTVRKAAELASAAAKSAPMEGRTLYAANRALAWPEEPVAALWHACTLLREHRGDGHVAALTAAGIGGRESHVIQAGAGIVSREIFAVARRYDEAEWQRVSGGLVERGLLYQDGTLTARGTDLRTDVEDRTDRLALSAFDSLDDEELHELVEALDRLARAVVDSGDLPKVTPIGVRLDLTP